MRKFLKLAACAFAMSLASAAVAGPGCGSGEKQVAKTGKSSCTTVAKASCTDSAGMVKGGGAECSDAEKAAYKAGKSCDEAAGMVKGGGAECSDAEKAAYKAGKSCDQAAGMVKGGGADKAACKTAGKSCGESAGMVKGGGAECSDAEKAACKTAGKSCGEAAGMVKGGGAECSDAEKAACKAACEAAGKSCGDAGMVKGGGDKGDTGYSLGQTVPSFTLTNAADGKEHSLADFAGKVVVLTFYNQDCPYVVEAWDRMDDFSKRYQDKGVQFLAIDPGTNVADDKRTAHAKERAFPILVNNTSELAINFKATRTPEVFILDQKGAVQYHGAFDNGQAGEKDGRKTWAEDAVKALLDGKTPEVRETKAFGCSIKFNRDTLNKKKEASTVKMTDGSNS